MDLQNIQYSIKSLEADTRTIMKKVLKYVSISLAAFVILVMLARISTLLIGGFSFNTSLKNAATPLGTPLFWKSAVGLVFLVGLYMLRVPFVNHIWERHKKRKVVAILILSIGGLALVSWLGHRWYVLNDQKNEYDYEVPELGAKLQENGVEQDKILRGANVFGWERVSETSFKHLEKLGISSVTLMPFDYQIAADEPSIKHIEDLNGLRQKDSTFIKLIALCKSQQLTVMLKPHLWIENGWRDEFKFETKEEWDLWFADYSKLTLQYAKVAEAGGADIFCIGTELLDSVKQQPDKWRELILEIKKIYSGKLTYAANWDEEYKAIPFWDALDFIGIQAYYPMKVEGDVSVESLKKAVKPYLDTLSGVSRRYDKKVIFTELGYRSIENNYKEPWAWPTDLDIFTRVYSEQSQAMAYEALMSASFGQEWFAGGYIWEYDFNEDDGPQALQHMNFSPRYKKTEKVIEKYYKGK